jgi:hypothetical protein
MAIVGNPRRNQTTEKSVEAFIAGAGQGSNAQVAGEPDRDANKQPVMIRIAPELLRRIDQGAKRLGISRSAFLCSSAAEKLERMEQ